MSSPMGDPADAKPTDPAYELALSQFQGELAERLSVEQMFILIDGVLPFEACLYYQVLPLFVEGSRLHLGMVSPRDTSATDYVRRIVSYHNYSLVPRSISSEALQAVLTAYLNYSGKQQSKSEPGATNRPRRSTARARSDQQINPNIQQTLVVDSPDELELTIQDAANHLPQGSDPLSVPPIPTSESSQTLLLADDDLSEAGDVSLAASLDSGTSVIPPSNLPSVQPTTKVQSNTNLQVQVGEVPDFESPVEGFTNLPVVDPVLAGSPALDPAPATPPLLHPLHHLDIQTNYLSSPIEALATLPPKELLQELLGRVLHDGIGRLYFERQPHCGRILWSESGVLQSVIDRLQDGVFQGLINELKHLTGLSLIPIQKPKQVEIERIHQQTRLLLRFKFIPTDYGEEATLQVLRGAALKFYQQQQLANLERDALTIAKQLQTKISEIRDRTRAESGTAGAKLDALPALSQLLKSIEEQLGSLQDDSPNGEPPNSAHTDAGWSGHQ